MLVRFNCRLLPTRHSLAHSVTSSSGTPKTFPPRSFVTICTSTRLSPSLSRLCVFTTPKSSPQEYLVLYLPKPCPKHYPIPELLLAISLLVPQSLRLRTSKNRFRTCFILYRMLTLMD
ncbi:unnamed protein product [Laminaria digitata]